MSELQKQFVSQESTTLDSRTLALLWRFISGLKLLLVFLPLSLTCITIGAFLPSGFLWIIAKMADCQSYTSCLATIPYLNIELTLSISFLIWLVLISTAIRIAGWIFFEIPGQLATRTIHRQMISGLAHTRTTYFDENPSGRLLNRLVRDYDQVRLMAVVRMGDFINSIIEIIAIAGVAFLSHYLVGILIIPLILWILYAQLHVSMMLQRCAIFRSTRIGEVLHRETDVIEGARTFYLYDQIPALFKRVRQAFERFLQAHLMHMRIEAWGFLWTGIAGTLFTTIAVFTIGYQTSHEMIDVVVAGAILTSLTRLSPAIGWCTWVIAYLLESVAHIRRVFEIVDLAPEETSEKAIVQVLDTHQKIVDPPPTPAAMLSGDLVFNAYSMSYRIDSPLILRDLSVTFPVGKEIGVIGRTGAGKTSLMQSLFRMVYVQSGDITIGGRSLLTCPIDFARSHFAVVPQDPYLFAGSLRENLDPYGEYNEAELARVIREVGLSVSPAFNLIEGGENLSRGERQLLCLARTILGSQPFVLMDEPTSGVDSISDAKIQNVLFQVLRGRTVITIAHRLNTLSQYDWIIELSEGQLLRAGHAQELLK
jgi:ABC-type multidrug transport system fused ATPase/permease subunit